MARDGSAVGMGMEEGREVGVITPGGVIPRAAGVARPEIYSIMKECNFFFK